MVLLEAVPNEVSRAVVDLARQGPGGIVPVVGCGGGPACHGHVVVLQDLLGLSPWQPPFAPPVADLGERIRLAAAAWAQRVESGEYLKSDHPYRMEK
jgi:3-methyl-2-oxobutanoate hydroxymethyltransferase